MTVFSNVYDAVITNPVQGIERRVGRLPAMMYLVVLITVPATAAWVALTALP